MAQSKVEVSGTISDCDVGRMSSPLLWCSHCAPTVLWIVGSTDMQLLYLEGFLENKHLDHRVSGQDGRLLTWQLDMCCWDYVQVLIRHSHFIRTGRNTKSKTRNMKKQTSNVWQKLDKGNKLHHAMFLGGAVEMELSASLKPGIENNHHAQNMLRILLLGKAQSVLFVLMEIAETTRIKAPPDWYARPLAHEPSPQNWAS